MECPLWLDEDFLCTLNYGPSDGPLFRKRLESVLKLLGEEQQRERITLLDRTVAEKLHKAIFREHYTGARFLIDWSDEPKWLILGEEDSITPFDYDPSASETKLFMTVENFITNELLDPYFLRSALCDPRPSIVPIALDIIDLVNYFASLPAQQDPNQSSKSVNEYLLDFFKTRELRSVDKPASDVAFPTQFQPKVFGDHLILGYLADIFKSVAFLQEDNHLELLGRQFPGPNLILGASPSTPSSSLTQIFLDDFKADFICSGPFKLVTTNDIRQHLRLTEKNEIQLFLNCTEFRSMYKGHSWEKLPIQIMN